MRDRRRPVLIACALAWLAVAAPAGAVGPESSTLEQEPDYRDAVAAIRSARYEMALSLLHRLQPNHPAAPEVANWLGYAYRKLRRYPESKRWYDQALLLDPAYRPALEYQGEWFIETGDIASARRNLARLEALCGRCSEWRDLAESLSAVDPATPKP